MPFRARLAAMAAAIAVSAIAASAAPSAAAALAAGPPAVSCFSRTVPVTVGSYAGGHITGQLCTSGPPSGQTLQILVPGATYTAWYWRPAGLPQRYSYMRAVTDAGYAAWDISRPGTDGPGYPPAADLTIPDEAAALHQSVAAARRWGYTRIILVGHSLGPDIALTEAATWHDVQAVILTGALHALNQAGLAAAEAAIWPAASDPKFRHAHLPPGYLTTRPGTREETFCGPSCTPAVNAADEKYKSTGTAAELAGSPRR